MISRKQESLKSIPSLILRFRRTKTCQITKESHYNKDGIRINGCYLTQLIEVSIKEQQDLA